MEASIGRPRPIPTKLGIFSRWVEKFRFLKTSIGLTITFVCISVYVVDASIAPFGSKQESGCGQSLRMFSRDIRYSQIETSSNKKDASKVRDLDGIRGWCPIKNDNHPWVMIDLIMQMKIQALVFGFDAVKQYNNEIQFHVEYGNGSDILKVYSEDGNPKIFNRSINKNSLQMVLLRYQVVARMMKIQFLNVTGSQACLNLELICCQLLQRKEFNYPAMDMYAWIGLNRSLKRDKRVLVNNTGVDMDDNNGSSRLLKRNKRSWYDKYVLKRLKHTGDDANYGSNMLLRRNKRGYEQEDIYDKKGTILSPGFPYDYPDLSGKMIKIHGGVQYVKLTVLYVSLKARYNIEDKLVLELGYTNEILITRGNQHSFIPATFFSTSHDVTISPNSYYNSHYRTGGACMYQLQYERVDYPGCDIDSLFQVRCSAQTAFITSRLYSSLFKGMSNDVIEIKGKYGQYIIMHFIDIDLCTPNHVEVFDVDVNTGLDKQLLWSSKDTRALQLVKSCWHIIKIKSETGGKLKGRGFLGRYEILDVQWLRKDFSATGCRRCGQFNFHHSCYFVEEVNGFISQQYAEEMCQNNGGHLASIGSEQEMEFIFSLCVQKIPKVVNGHSVLIGLLKGADYPWYQWIDGQPLVYAAWFAGSSMYPPQPDGDKEERCTALVFSNGHNLHNWHDVPCINHTGMFVCEMESDNQNYLPANGWNLTNVLPIDGERFFRCETNEAVIKQAVCDSLPNCFDNSDEMHCEDADKCSNIQFRCGDGNCIPWAYYCDHVPQCKDESDERACYWPKCLTSEWKCDNNQCIPKYQRCDLTNNCFDGSDEANCGYAFAEFRLTKRFSKEIKQAKQSCEDWWFSGARWNGTFIVAINSVDTEVVCIFKVSNATVVISTSIDKPATLNHYELPFPGINQYELKNCSLTVEITCYRKTIDRDDQIYEFIQSICQFGDCKCLNKTNWGINGLDTVLSHTDSITVYDQMTISNLTDMSTYTFIGEWSYSFVYITLSPVICTTELPLTSNQNNITSTMKRCIFDFESKKCTDVSHLQDCDEFVCPYGYFKCPQSFCLSSEFVCDGTKQCPNGNDETFCETRRCPGLFRCRESTICLAIEKVCDGIAHCPMLDDEVGCNTACPEACSCYDSVIVCQFTDFPDEFGRLVATVRKSDMSYSHFRENVLSVPDMPYVGELICHDCNIKWVPSFSLENLTNLLFLDLSYNRIKTVTNRTFYHLTKLRRLNLAGNLLKTLEDFSFVGLKSLQCLNVSSNQIHTLENKAFNGLGSLNRINLMHNLVDIFSGEIFFTLRNLTELSSDLFHFCCPGIKPKTVTRENCYPQQDGFSSCEDLIRNATLRTSIWIVGILSFFGNLVVILYRFKHQKREPLKAHGLYVLNLSISDMLMGIYLLLISVADAYYKGDYVSSDISWRNGPYCKLAGVLSTMSSEASVTFILFLTTDCFLKVRYPFKIRYHLTIRKAIVSSVVSWITVVVLAILPNLYKPYFADYFFSQTSVCLALPFSKKKTEGWEYSVALFVVYNSVAFLVIAFMQIGIYNAGKSSNRVIKTNSKQDFVLARRITLILVTDFLCWVPIGILGIISLQGHVFPPDLYAWVAVFVLPINSALNPLLYTFSDVLNEKLKELKEAIQATVFKYSMRNRRKKCAYRMFDWTIPTTTHLKRRKLSCEIKSLSDALKGKELKPAEAFTLVFDIVQRVADLHKNGYTVVNNINPDTVLVYLDKKIVIQAEIDSRIKKLVYRNDIEKSIEDIGLLTIAILRNLNKGSKNR